MHPLDIHCLHTVLLIQQKNKFDYYRGKNCMKNFYLNLGEHATKIINYEKKEMRQLAKKKRKCILSKKRFSIDDSKNK